MRFKSVHNSELNQGDQILIQIENGFAVESVECRLANGAVFVQSSDLPVWYEHNIMGYAMRVEPTLKQVRIDTSSPGLSTHKIASIRAIRAASTLGLKEAKDAVEDGNPFFIQSDKESQLVSDLNQIGVYLV